MACFDVEAPIVCIAINQTTFLAFVLRSGSMGKLQRLEEILRYVITVRFTTDSLDYFAKQGIIYIGLMMHTLFVHDLIIF